MRPWIMGQVCINLRSVLGEIWVAFHLCYLPGPLEVPAADFGERDFSTEAEMKRQRRLRSARISLRLMPLARSASASIDFLGRDHSRTLLEQAFDGSMYQLK